MSANCCYCCLCHWFACCCHWVVFCTWVVSVFWISPVWISKPPRRMLMFSNSQRVELDCHGWIVGGNPSESEDWACYSCHLDPLALCQPDPPVSYGCGAYPQPGWCPGVNPGICMVGSHPDIYIWGTGGVSVDSGYYELQASFLVLLHVDLREAELLHASSCSIRMKVSAGDLYKRRSGLGNGISFVYPGK
jgi:hypothetical protein